MSKLKKGNETGITLIALVITIVVMLIITTVSIRIIFDENGVINRAHEARESQIESQYIENEVLTELEDEIKKVDWEEKLARATQPHPDQTQSNDIGVGTDGELVNLDFWQYTKMYNESKIMLSKHIGCGMYEGYIGPINNGEIIGTVPQYIKLENEDFIKIKNLVGTFYNCTSLEKAPVLPSGIENMEFCFKYCTNLIIPPVIPNSITGMWGIFYGCTSLVNAPVIPNNVRSLRETFYGCTSLVNAPVIPNSVTDISGTFYECRKLTGDLIINCARFDGNWCYSDALNMAATEAGTDLKLSGTSPYLNNILKTKSSNSNISLKIQ